MIYGNVEMRHRCEYDAFGALRRAEIAMLDEEPTILEFNGAPAEVVLQPSMEEWH